MRLLTEELSTAQQDALSLAFSEEAPGPWLVVHSLTGDLDVDRLRRAIEALGSRTAIFGRSFVKSAGSWSMVSAPDVAPSLDEWDLRDRGPDVAFGLLRDLRHHHYRPEAAPLARFHLIHLPDSWLLAFSAASWLIDRFSLESIYTALSEAYAADAPGGESIDLDQASLLAEEEAFLQSPEAPEAERFWVSQLKDRRTQFTPARWPQAIGESTWHLEVPPSAVAGAVQVIQQLGLNPGRALASVLHLYLARMTGSDAILTQVNRRLGQAIRPHASSPVGFSEGPSMVMSHPASDLRVRDFLLDTQRLNEYAVHHGRLPAAWLNSAIRRTEPGFTRFTNVEVDLDTLPYTALDLPGVTSALRPEASYRTPSADIAFSINVLPNPEVTVRVRDPQVLPALRESMPAIIHRLECLPADLDRRIGDLTWLTGEQRSAMISLAGAGRPFEQQPSFLDRFVDQVRTTPDAEAVRFEGRTLTYRELLSAADAVAEGLRPVLDSSGDPDPLVGICLPRGAGMIVALIGIMRAGAGYVPLDPTNPSDRLQYILADSRAVAVIVDAQTTALIGEDSPTTHVFLPEREAWTSRSDEPIIDTPYDDTSVAYVIYTSGTTGQPKGVVVERGNLAAYLSAMDQVAPAAPGDRWLQFASINFDASVLEIGNCLARGACLVVTPSDVRSDPEAVMDLLDREGITHAFIPPAMLRSLPRRALPSLCDVFVGGEASDDATVAFWSRATRLWNGYGPTETTVMSSAKLMSAQRSAADLGGPLPGYTMFVLDAHLEPVPPGATGEIWIGGPGVTRGYLGREELTAEKFIANPFGPGRLYRTGDLARHFPNGDLEYLGRNDFQVKIRGFRMELGDIEAAIADVSGVTGVYVTVIDGAGGKSLGAWYTAGPDPAEVAEVIGRRLPHYMVPAHLVRLETFPVNMSGKVDRTRLPMPADEVATSADTAMSPREQAIRDIWAEVLGIPASTLGPDSHFFHVGGHSLVAAVACHHIAERTGLPATPRALFEHPVLADFCAALDEGDQPAPLEPLQATGTTQTPVPGAMLEMMQRRSAQNGNDTAYTIVMRVDVGPEVNPMQLRAAVRDLLEADPVFRTRFFEERGVTMMVVDPDAIVDVPLRTDVDVDELAMEFRDTAFDLGRAPLWRAEVLLGESGSSLMFAINHGIFDGWSLNVMLKELAARYDALQSGLPFDRTAPTMLDYGAWLSEHGDDRQRAIDYWSAKLADATCRTELPTSTGHSRPDSNRELSIALPATVTNQLKDLASQLEMTLSPVVFAAYLVWLWRITGQRELSVAYPYASRDVPNTDAVLGMFVQMGFLRIDIDPDEPFAELAGRVARQMIDDREHLIASPYDTDLSRCGAPNILFSLQSGIGLDATYGSVTFRAHEYSSRSSKADLAAILYEGADGQLEGRLEYDASALDGTALPPLLDCLTHLIPGLVDNADLSVSSLPYLPPEQVQQIDAFISGGDIEASPSTLVRAWRTAAIEYAAMPAIQTSDRTLSFAEVDRLTDLLAARIVAEAQPRPEQPIGLSGAKSAELVMAAIAILKAGCAYVPLDPHYPADRLRYIMEDAGVHVIVADDDATAILNGVGLDGLSFIDPYAPSSATDAEIASLPDPDPRAMAYVIYTSGSTGRPKGVMIEHATVPRMIQAGADLMGFTPGDRMLLLGTLNFDASVVQLFAPLLTGGTLVIPRPDAEKDPAGLHEVLAEREVTHVVATPSLIRNLPKVPLPALRFLGFGGEAIDTPTASYWSEQTSFYSLYGPTETTVMCTGGQILPGANSRIIGKPLAGYTVSLRNESLDLVPLGATGEIIIGGGGAARGYLGRPDLTLEKFAIDPDGVDPYELVYRSGDLGRYLADGTIEFLGRNDDQVKLRGFRIELGEIESAMESAPGVTHAAAMVRGEGDLRMIVGYVAGPSDLDIDAVRAHCSVSLPDYMVPTTFVPMESMPLNANGKLDRRALPDVSFTSTSEPPRDGMEQRIAQVWEELLNLHGVGREDNFFRLGGNSLLAARLQTMLRQQLDLDISTTALYAEPTIAGIAGGGPDSAISQAVAAAQSAITLDGPVAPKVASDSPPSVLHTGATGFLGSYLLGSLLDRASRVTCIVRGTSRDEAQASLARHAREAGLDIDFSRVDVVLGDLAAPGLGLSAEDSRRLADTIDVIVHCGAWVHHLYSYATLRSSNVDATVDLVRLALGGARRASMCFVSTESVAEALDGITSVAEEVLDPQAFPPISDSGYLLTKWVAEQLVAGAVRDHGLDAIIARPGNITGDTRTGFSNYGSNHFWLFTKACVQLGAVPRLNSIVETTPVDVLADAIATLSLEHTPGLRVANLSNPVSVSWVDWLTTVTDLTDTPLVVEDPATWQGRLADITEENALWSLRSLYSGDLGGEFVPVDRKRTQAELADLGSPTASDPHALAALYVPYLIEEGFLPS